MRLTPEQLCDAYDEFAARLGISNRVANAEAIRDALRMAEKLASEEPASQPAALFYAFARYPRAFPGLTRLMTSTIAMTVAREHGIALGRRDADALEAMVFGVTRRHVDYRHVLEFFRSRTPQA